MSERLKATRIWSLCVLLLILPVGIQASPLTVVDDAGRAVSLSAPAKRVLALAPHAVEMLYTVGAGETLIGVIEGSDYPEAARALPRVGSYRGISLEAVLVRNPDLVVVWGSGTPQSLVERLAALNVPVYRSEPRQLLSVAKGLRDLGKLTGHGEEGEWAASSLMSRLEMLKQSLGDPPRVFYQLGDNPLTTLSGGHIVTEVIRHCGGKPLFDDKPVLVPQIGNEALIEARPEVILSAQRNDDWKRAWQRWELLPAVENQRLYNLSPDLISRPGPRIVEAVKEVCEAISPANQ